MSDRKPGDKITDPKGMCVEAYPHQSGAIRILIEDTRATEQPSFSAVGLTPTQALQLAADLIHFAEEVENDG